jgi:hypothetical protein
MIPLDWEWQPAVVVASGPSLCQEDVDWCRGKARVIVVNDCWRMAPWADALYAADLKWWDYHGGVPEFAGEKWTCDKTAAAKYGLLHVVLVPGEGYSRDRAKIHRLGGNGGGQAANIALLRGAWPVLLLGFDMQPTGGKKHWFGDHPKPLDRAQNFVGWKQAMDAAALDCITNCSRETALTAYRRGRIQECLPAAPSA